VSASISDGQRQVGGQGLPDRLAVVPGLGDRERLEVGLDPVRDLVQDVGPLGGAGQAPGAFGAVGGVQRKLDVLGGGPGHLGERLAGDGREVLEVLALARRDELAADVVAVPVLHRHEAVALTGCFIQCHWWTPFTDRVGRRGRSGES